MDSQWCPECKGTGKIFRVVSPEEYKRPADSTLFRNRALYTMSFKCELCKGRKIVNKQVAFEWKLKNEK